MTIQEWSNEFDIHYNNLAGNSAPNLDLYEKSVYLTKAQLEIVKNMYDPLSNPKGKGFEGSEKRRVDLKELIKDFKTSDSFTSTSSIHNNSKFVRIPNDVFLIVNEELFVNNCKYVDVVPTTYDEWNIIKNNPFKKHNQRRALRLDFSKINNEKVVEIVTTYNTFQYRLRYLKYPKPIILADLNILYPEDNLSIDNMSSLQNCELDEQIHRQILDRAIQLALRDYYPQTLESKIQLDTRNE